jgi:predicted nucleic acid-binding protein
MYLDASVLVPMQVHEPKSVAVRQFILQYSDTLFVSSLAAGEFVSAMSRFFRMKIITKEAAESRIALFDTWMQSTTAVPVNNADIQSAATLVRRFDLKLLMPDAIHAALCARHKLTLVTLDDRLTEACGVIGVDVVVPG